MFLILGTMTLTLITNVSNHIAPYESVICPVCVLKKTRMGVSQIFILRMCLASNLASKVPNMDANGRTMQADCVLRAIGRL